MLSCSLPFGSNFGSAERGERNEIGQTPTTAAQYSKDIRGRARLLFDWRHGPEPSVSVDGKEISIFEVCSFVLQYQDERLRDIVRTDILGLLDDRYKSLIGQLAEGAGTHAGARVLIRCIGDRRYHFSGGAT